jgi:hypothetical protein
MLIPYGAALQPFELERFKMIAQSEGKAVSALNRQIILKWMNEKYPKPADAEQEDE